MKTALSRHRARLARLAEARSLLEASATLEAPDGLNVVVLTPTFFPVLGGAEVGIDEIYRRLACRHNVTIVTPAMTDGDAQSLPSCARRYGVLRFRIRLLRSRKAVVRALAYLGLEELAVLWRLSQRTHISVVNIHYVRPHGLVALYCRYLLQVPTVLSLVGRTDVYSSLSLPRKLHYAVTLRAAGLVTQNSEYYLEGSPYAADSVVPYGSDLPEVVQDEPVEDVRRRFSIGENDLVLLAVQRLVRDKRVDLLLPMLEKLNDDQIAATLVIVGDGSERIALESETKSRGLQNVRFTGRVSRAQLAALYRTADVFVTHSVDETFGVMLAEAMSMGLPIVAPRATCIPLVVRDGRDGTLFEPYDIEEFAQQVERLCSDRSLREEIGRAGQMRAAREFSWDTVSEAYEGQLLAAAGVGPQ
jgi:glycosyltransferase involved in cell wall biosynthesis